MCYKSGICLVDPTSPIKIEGYFSVQKFGGNALHFQANFNRFGGGLQQSGHPFSCTDSTHSYAHGGHVWISVDLFICRQPPQYLWTKTCQQIFLKFTKSEWSADSHKQWFFLVVPDFCGGCYLHPFQRPSSYAGREWYYDIGDNDGGFLQCSIPFHDVNSKGKLKISDQYLSIIFVLLPFCLSNHCFSVCAEKMK